MQLSGRSIIGYHYASQGAEKLRGINPATGEALAPEYYSATKDDVDFAARLADKAFSTFSRTTGAERAAFLRRIATKIEALGDELTSRAIRETGLPAARIQGETARTCGQLRLFADLVEDGSWVDARIDRADAKRKPLPKPDMRSMLRPIGPVVVFCASNFPLAFSVAGGDTASAFAAGCPVIVKAHHAHPGTAELVGSAFVRCTRTGTCRKEYSHCSTEVEPRSESNLVRHHLVKAGGFTGSRSGGRALFDAASSRPEPIPFYAEMSSVNPVFILPEAMRGRGQQIAEGLHASVTLGAGQFCTKPGLVFVEEGDRHESFASKLSELMSATPEFTMLTPGIRKSYHEGVTSRAKEAGVATVAQREKRAGTRQAVRPALCSLRLAQSHSWRTRN